MRPVSFVYRPLAHSAHAAWPASGLTVPALHSVALAEPTEHHVPGPHSMQSPALVIGSGLKLFRLVWPDAEANAHRTFLNLLLQTRPLFRPA